MSRARDNFTVTIGVCILLAVAVASHYYLFVVGG